MIIDKILDRKDGEIYNAKKFYNDVAGYGEIGFEINEALDSGSNHDVRKALSVYVIVNDYSPDICSYIYTKNWLTDDNR